MLWIVRDLWFAGDGVRGGGGWNEDLGFELMGETCIQAAAQGCGGTR